MKTVVIDASVILKVYLDEPDTEQALDFIQACTTRYWSLIAPNLLQYEIADVAMKRKHDIERFGVFLETYMEGLISQSSPTLEIWQLADKMTRTGHKKSGYPAIYDSVYHAMAIAQSGVFVTADHTHYSKAKEFGHIVMLRNWNTIFDD